MVYPQYWCTNDCQENFEKHIQLIKSHYCQPKTTYKQKTKSKKQNKKALASNAIVDVHELGLGSADGTSVIPQVGYQPIAPSSFSQLCCSKVTYKLTLVHCLYDRVPMGSTCQLQIQRFQKKSMSLF